MLVRRHLEVCVFSYLAAELRSGDIAVAGSDSYANLHDQLMSWEECRPLAAAFCAQAGIPAALTAHYRSLLASTAARVDAGYPSNTDLALEGDQPVLRRRKGLDRRPEALRLEAVIHERLPQRALLDILTRTAYLLGWHHHFGPASGSDPKIRDTLARYVLAAFAYGTLLGPAQAAAHMRGKVSVHELTLAGNKHATAAKAEKASATVVNAFSKLDVTAMWGDGKTAAADGSQIDTWEDNLLAETSVRYGGYGGYRLVQPFHPVRGVGGGLHHRGPAQERQRRPARHDPRGHPGPFSRCRSSGLPPCRGSTCCPVSGTGTNWSSTARMRARGTSASTRCSATRRSTGASSKLTGRTCSAPRSRSGKTGCRRSHCCAGSAITPARTAFTEPSASAAGRSGPSRCFVTCQSPV